MIVVARNKRALYFGCRGPNEPGHYLQEGERTIWDPPPELPWHLGHLDGGLLKNGEHRDIEDGKVWWTCGGTPLWLVFMWWDRSGDKRGASNSAFCVQGFDHTQPQAALEYAMSVYPKVIQRQRFPLVLQEKRPAAA
jgi:hypothetical protein